ncbi:hypothetical protein ACS127_15470 [Amphibacillus sp. Q70]|uniref:hypothetical protein n=1 Tax=Amphibacillus sp. Q70 TaxID=3453416 RepID=UPI003F84D1B2
MHYQITFVYITHGEGILNLHYDSYKHCHNAKDTISRTHYQKDVDPKYPSSIFAGKGSITNVISWY